MSRYSWPTARRAEEDHDDPAARARYVSRRRTDFDPDGALVAGRRLPERPPGPLAGGLFAPASGRQHLWQPLGPATVIAGQTIGTPRIAGRVRAIAVHPDGERIYAASGNGGVWYSNDGGGRWRSLGGLAATNRPEVTRPAHRNACGALFVDFGATDAGDEVFVGTGETTGFFDAQPGHSLGGVGVMVATGPATSPLDDPWSREAPNLLGHGVNRFAQEPGGATMVAATTIGLLQRPDPAGIDEDWERVDGTPFATLTDECTDVLWRAGDGTRPERLWVWVRTGANAGLWFRPPGEVNFQKLATPGFAKRRAVLAAATPPNQIFVLNDRGTTAAGAGIPPNLYRIATADANVPVVTVVTGVPNVLGAQGFYDIGMAVHPTNANQVVLVGNTFDTVAADGTALDNDAAVVVGTVAPVAGTLTFTAPTMIGVGVHADVHDVKYTNGGARLWVGCDGGVYRSDNTVSAVGFRPCNTGLSIVESNYVAGHPTCEGFLVTGLQDNAVITRRSNTVWESKRVGDGGGVVFDPVNPTQFMRQHFQGLWSLSVGTENGDHPLNRAGAFANGEHDASAFYSEAAGIAHRRTSVAPALPDVGQVLIGTTRVWYTEDFGTNWVTLPTGNDPLPGNLTQDAFSEEITVCRWQSPDVAWILGEGKLMRYARAPGSDAGGGPGTWTREMIVERPGKQKKDDEPEQTMRRAAVWTDVAPNLDPPPGAGQPPGQRGTKGAAYLGTIGKPGDPLADTVYWFDGTDTWHPTLLRTDTDGVPAPVTAIACDPAHPEEVWVGTTIGVWRGVRTLNGANPPTWDWEARVNGLPEAGVEDLEIFTAGTVRLLRAAIAARGLWELRLDTADVEDLVYVRANDDDLRHRDRAIETQRDLTTARSWHGSPDVRPRVASAALAAPTSLDWTRSFFDLDNDGLRRFQSALRSRSGDQRVRPTGEWDDYFNEVLRDLGAPLRLPPAAPNTVSINEAFWNAQMTGAHATRDPWGSGPPTEEDLYELTAALAEGDLQRTSCSLGKVDAKVDVVVHHRGLGSLDGADVRVTLLRWIDPKTKNRARWNDHTTWFAADPLLPVPWTAAVNEVLNSAPGTTTQNFAGGWAFVGTTAATRRQTLAGQTLDPMRSGVATFDLSLTGRKKNDVVLLVAVVRAGGPIALAPATLEELALTSPSVAVRSLRVLG
ncbi:MAG: hypothetical protein ACR2HQ_05795 [Ilumatobacteraceae bacterium]